MPTVTLDLKSCDKQLDLIQYYVRSSTATHPPLWDFMMDDALIDPSQFPTLTCFLALPENLRAQVEALFDAIDARLQGWHKLQIALYMSLHVLIRRHLQEIKTSQTLLTVMGQMFNSRLDSIQNYPDVAQDQRRTLSYFAYKLAWASSAFDALQNIQDELFTDTTGLPGHFNFTNADTVVGAQIDWDQSPYLCTIAMDTDKQCLNLNIATTLLFYVGLPAKPRYTTALCQALSCTDDTMECVYQTLLYAWLCDACHWVDILFCLLVHNQNAIDCFKTLIPFRGACVLPNVYTVEHAYIDQLAHDLWQCCQHDSMLACDCLGKFFEIAAIALTLRGTKLCYLGDSDIQSHSCAAYMVFRIMRHVINKRQSCSSFDACRHLTYLHDCLKVCPDNDDWDYFLLWSSLMLQSPDAESLNFEQYKAHALHSDFEPGLEDIFDGLGDTWFKDPEDVKDFFGRLVGDNISDTLEGYIDMLSTFICGLGTLCGRLEKCWLRHAFELVVKFLACMPCHQIAGFTEDPCTIVKGIIGKIRDSLTDIANGVPGAVDAYKKLTTMLDQYFETPCDDHQQQLSQIIHRYIKRYLADRLKAIDLRLKALEDRCEDRRSTCKMRCSDTAIEFLNVVLPLIDNR